MFIGFLLSDAARLINAQSREKHGDRRVFLCFDLFQICSFPYLLQEVREPVRLVVAASHEGDAGGSAVGDDVVHLPADRVEVSPRLGVFFIGGKLLRPP